jgi:hypothetical protein
MGVIFYILFFRFLSNEWVVETVYEYYKKDDPQGACARLV